MIQGLFYNHLSESYTKVEFDSPADIFRTNTFTIIGACIEKNLIMVGLENAFNFPVSNIDSDILSQFIFDEHPRGDVLFIETDEKGIPISLNFELIYYPIYYNGC